MKYELVQWYPSLPIWLKEGDVVVKSTCIIAEEYGIMKKKPTRTHVLPATEVENNPDFWKEVKEKEYEILSFRGGAYYKGEACKTFVKDHDDLYKCEGCKILDEEQLLNSTARIDSVKRLSDGEVFTVGDFVSSEKGWSRYIESIELSISKDTIFIYGKGLGNPSRLSKIRHSKRKSLFTTHDDVEIYEDDYVWVPQKSKIKTGNYVLNGEVVRYKTIKPQHYYVKAIEQGVIYFSTEEAAKEWIHMNELVYSRKDFEEWRQNKIDKL